MQGQRIDSSIFANAKEAPEESREPSAQAAIIGLLLSKDHHGVWSKEELVRELSAPRLDVIDAIANLRSAGLAHELDGFVIASRAAWSMDHLDL
jgi:hypothetical protein